MVVLVISIFGAIDGIDGTVMCDHLQPSSRRAMSLGVELEIAPHFSRLLLVERESRVSNECQVCRNRGRAIVEAWASALKRVYLFQSRFRRTQSTVVRASSKRRPLPSPYCVLLAGGERSRVLASVSGAPKNVRSVFYK